MAAYSQQNRQSPGHGQHITRSPIRDLKPPTILTRDMPHSPGKSSASTKGIRTYPGYDKVAAMVAGGAQAVIGGLFIILGIAIAVVSKGAGNSAHPIWGGIIIVVAGTAALISARTKRRDCIIVALGVSAFCLILDIMFWSVAAVAIRGYKSVLQSLWTALHDDLVALWGLVVLFAIIHIIFVVVQIVFCVLALRGTCVTRAPPPPGQVYSNECIPTQSFTCIGAPNAAGHIGPIQGGNQPCISLPLPMDPKQTYTIIYGPDKSGVKGCYFLSIMPEYIGPSTSQQPQTV